MKIFKIFFEDENRRLNPLILFRIILFIYITYLDGGNQCYRRGVKWYTDRGKIIYDKKYNWKSISYQLFIWLWNEIEKSVVYKSTIYYGSTFFKLVEYVF